jgi:hypothetical protein
MIGQLQDAGNTTTLAHYLELLTGLQKFASHQANDRLHDKRKCKHPAELSE